MNRFLPIVTAGVASLAGAVSAQSASVSLEAPSMSAAPGETVTVSVVATFDTSGAGAGVFGAAGLYGFGGDVSLTGDGATGASSAVPTVDAGLSFGATASSSGAAVRAAGGRGFDGGIATAPYTLATFDVTIGAGASGDAEIGFDGAVILVQGDALVTYATNPGANQQTLSVSPLTISVGSSRLCADQNNDGVLNGADFNAWLANFAAGSPLADVNNDGSLNGADFNAWLAAFAGGAAGPTCSP